MGLNGCGQYFEIETADNSKIIFLFMSECKNLFFFYSKMYIGFFFVRFYSLMYSFMPHFL